MKLLDRFKNAIGAFKGVKMNDEEFLEWMGVRGTNRSVLSEVTYFTCLKMLAETIGKLPVKFYQSTTQGKIRAEPNKVYDLMSNRPNSIMTPSILWSTVENNRNHYGNAYVWIHKVFKHKKGQGRYGGEYEILDIWPMPSQYVTPLMDDKGVFGEKGKLYYQYCDKYSGEMYVFKSQEVLHFKTSYSFDGITGEPVQTILKSTVSGALESQKFMNNLYENGLTASMVMQYTGDLDETRLVALQNKYSKYLTGAKNAGKIVPVPMGLQLQPLNVKLTDAQFFELKKYGALQIAGAFGIKPNQINDYEKSSYSNSEMQQLSFLVDTMLYIIKQYEEEINGKLLTEQERLNGFYFKFNEKAILRTDSKTQMENLTSAVNNGIYLVNEAREYLDLPVVEGGDVPIVNGNYIPLTEVGNQYKKGEDGNAKGITVPNKE